MSKGVNIPIAADARGVITEGRKVEGALEDVIDSLDDVGEAGKDAGKEAEKGLDNVGEAADDAAKEADQAAERLERSFKDSFEAVSKKAKDTGNDVERAMKDGTDGGSAGLDDLKGEAAGTATEVAASFDGSAESIAGGFQEVAANAFAGFGPAGAAAGIAAAAGIGLLMSQMEKAKEKAAEAAEEIAGITAQLIELGSRDLDAQSVSEAIEAAGSAAEDGKIEINEWAKAATDAGIDFADYAQGLAGDSEAIKRSYAEVTKELDAYSQEGQRLVDTYGLESDEAQDWADVVNDERVALEKAKKALEDKDGTLNKSAATYDNVKKAQEGLNEQTEREAALADEAAAAIDAKAQIEQDATADLEAYASALEGMAEPAGLYAEAMETVKTRAEETAAAAKKTPEEIAKAGEDAVATLDDVLTELAEEVRKKEEFEANLKNLAERGFGALAEELRASGPDAAAAVTDLLAKGNNAQVQQYATDTGKLTGESLGQGAATGVAAKQAALQTSVNNTVGSITVPGLTIPLSVQSTVVTTEIRKNNDGSYQTYVNGVPRGHKMV